ncbi:hypothetical protein H0H92_011400, partial [Tricholoma furcatifolium]
MHESHNISTQHGPDAYPFVSVNRLPGIPALRRERTLRHSRQTSTNGGIILSSKRACLSYDYDSSSHNNSTSCSQVPSFLQASILDTCAQKPRKTTFATSPASSTSTTVGSPSPQATFRNEISPRADLLHVREFTMAEIEHYVDPTDKSHQRFAEVSSQIISLLDRKVQESGSNQTTRIIYPQRNRILIRPRPHSLYPPGTQLLGASTVLSLPPIVAPTKAFIVPLSSRDEFAPIVQEVSLKLRKAGVFSRVDDFNTSISKPYARNDELGTPF